MNDPQNPVETDSPAPPVHESKSPTPPEKRRALFVLLGLAIMAGFIIWGIVYVATETARGIRGLNEAVNQITDVRQGIIADINPDCFRQVSGPFGGTVYICDAPDSPYLTPPTPSSGK